MVQNETGDRWVEPTREWSPIFWCGALFALAFGAVAFFVTYSKSADSRMSDVTLLGAALVTGATCAGIGFVIGWIVGAIAEWPVFIAQGRGHPSADAIRVCAWIGVLIWPAWFVAMIWAHTNARAVPSTPVRRALAASDDTPGLFEVLGVDKETGMDTRVAIEAESGPNARVKAELRGVVVTDVRRVPLKM